MTLGKEVKKTDFVFVAYSYPYTFNDVIYSINEAQEKCLENDLVHFECRELVRSLEDRPLHMLTICSKKALIDQKPVVFLTGRVHSGESPSSYMIQGIIDKLMDFGDPQTEILLNSYVFKIIPMLNPDGVSRGSWKFDTLGQNLNNFYKDPQRDVHPTIWATKNAVVQEHVSGKLKMYVDFHARCSKRGAFILDNTISEPAEKYESMMIPKLMSLNCVNFDFRECLFSDDKSPGLKEKKGCGLEKDSQERASIFKETSNNPFTYTLDINYTSGHRINNLAWRYDVANDKKLLKEESPIQDTSSSVYKGLKSPMFCPEIYSDVGRSLLTAMLDYDQVNPVTRLVYQSGQSFATVLEEIRKELQKGTEKPAGHLKLRPDCPKQNKSEAKSEVAGRDGHNAAAPTLNRE